MKIVAIAATLGAPCRQTACWLRRCPVQGSQARVLQPIGGAAELAPALQKSFGVGG